ncbi:hypothetical protein [Melissococcus plutonius]|uniref:Uncharacterized protein n=2 Tax=Melissococcus plutonius TaxID=33970 RepID=F3YA22_MELPT|nr:hypothetical protein [Melissococcus plutonius]BAL62276.1 hypothetical protein MPD5_1051 [Melissococcus plutonius DAT561]BAK21350.1 hypothetical protein MPTP_0888 [Melissococcus plutonius ATCC 35311]BBC61159.1 hypothetical protein DAT561_1049 [Melissococcus plutonius]BBD15155.1 hypothetical protein DAT585_0805 [Melissococcus plutonius]BBD16595.1 hypothetical protein DAT606_0560 [Melissococcus plutonius]
MTAVYTIPNCPIGVGQTGANLFYCKNSKEEPNFTILFLLYLPSINKSLFIRNIKLKEFFIRLK